MLYYWLVGKENVETISIKTVVGLRVYCLVANFPRQQIDIYPIMVTAVKTGTESQAPISPRISILSSQLGQIILLYYNGG